MITHLETSFKLQKLMNYNYTIDYFYVEKWLWERNPFY